MLVTGRERDWNQWRWKREESSRCTNVYKGKTSQITAFRELLSSLRIFCLFPWSSKYRISFVIYNPLTLLSGSFLVRFQISHVETSLQSFSAFSLLPYLLPYLVSTYDSFVHVHVKYLTLKFCHIKSVL